MAISARYHSAVHAKSLRPDARKGDIGVSYTDIDTLGAYGRAADHLERGRDALGNDIRPAPLAVPLERLLAGDNGSAREIVSILAQMVWSKADRTNLRPKLVRTAAHDMACMCLAWHRNGRCRSCGGHGYTTIPGVPSLSAHECGACNGTGRILFEDEFIAPHRGLARWLLSEMESEMGRAAPAAMKALAARMDL